MAVILPNIAYMSPSQPASQTIVQIGAQVGTNKAQFITLHKIVKYYIYCKRDYYTENECHDKYPHFKEAKIATRKPDIKRRQNRKPIKNEPISNSGKGFYFIQPEQGLFMAIQANPLLSKLWI